MSKTTKAAAAMGAAVGAAVVMSAAAQAAPKKAASAGGAAPIATYWMDVTTSSGLGAGMAGGGGKPSLGDIMGMMSGRGPSYAHSLNLRLASRTPAPAAPQAQHMIPPALRMGPSLPLVSPAPAAPAAPEKYERPQGMDNPKGRMLIYWGCADRVSAGQPLVFDFAQMMSGKVPENIRKMSAMMGQMHGVSRSGPLSAPGFGEWPNARDGRAVPGDGSLVGAHRILGNYSPTIDFTLGQGQDFMAPMMLQDSGRVASNADLLRWPAVPNATGYALAMFGANENGDIVMWSSARSSGMANLDYLPPAEVARQIAAGNALPPATTQCALPAEVAQSVPAGMVMSIAYGPELHFADAPRSPKWAVTVRYKSSGSVMRGIGGMMGGADDGEGRPAQQQQQQAPKKKRGFGLGDLLGIPH